jgi:predicted MFS family arabinose efflux permease
MHTADRPQTRLATRLLFLVAGFGYSCWAPLVPFTKQRLGIDDHVLGMLLLCIGCGSMLAMIAAGMLTTRFGNKPVIVASGFGFALALALLPVADSAVALGLALAAFGATLGSLDVAMNLHAVEVERASGKALMSGFHAFFSIGGFAGSAFMTFLLSKQLGSAPSTWISAALIVAAMGLATPRLLQGKAARGGPLFAIPRGVVLLIAVLASITFLAEGALLDWSALLITESGLVSVAQGGMGYMFFSIAMTAGRLSGDAVSTRFGDRNTLVCGGMIALLGFLVLLTAASAAAALSGFVLIGLGCSNIVPVFFRRAAAQDAMPPGLAIAAISTTAYAGVLAGPAGIGFVAKATGLHTAFWMLAALLALVPFMANRVTARE